MSEALEPGLRHLPLALFGAPMGLLGLGLTWREAAVVLDAPAAVGEGLLLLGVPLYAVLVALHLRRALRYPEVLRADWRHPVRCGFVGAATIATMLVALALAPYAHGIAAALWTAAVAAQLLAGAALLRRVLLGGGEAAMLVPSLLLPLAGNLVAGISGTRLGFPGLSWALLGTGALLWLALQPLLLQRLVAGPPLPMALRPSLAILVAPPALTATGLSGLAGAAAWGPAAGLLGLSALLAAALLPSAPALARGPFLPSLWSWTFPFAALASATLALLPGAGNAPGGALAWAALAWASLTTGCVALRSLRAALAGAFLRPEGGPAQPLSTQPST